MKMLIVGDTTYKIYAYAFYKAAQKRKDLDVDIFDFGRLNTENVQKNLLKKFEVHYKNGIMVYELNCKLLKICKQHKYNMIFLYSSSLIYASTVKKLAERGVYIALFCNDNPFSEYYKSYIWKHLIASAQYANIVYVYRKSNIEDYKEQGAKRIKVLLPYYIEERNYYIPDEQIVTDVPEVVFIGHKENDGREKYISALLSKGIKVGLSGAWNKFEPENALIVRLSSDQKLYNELINKAQIAIVFLSKINEDTYTRRCFEIPAVKTMMIAPYTKELAELFEADKEIVFFNDVKDFVDKIEYYLEKREECYRIAEGGYNRLIKDGHEVKDRIQQIINDYKDFLKEKNI